jgi:hypothetical protein
VLDVSREFVFVKSVFVSDVGITANWQGSCDPYVDITMMGSKFQGASTIGSAGHLSTSPTISFDYQSWAPHPVEA